MNEFNIITQLSQLSDDFNIYKKDRYFHIIADGFTFVANELTADTLFRALVHLTARIGIKNGNYK